MKKRIIFGAIMIAVLAGLLWLDWRLELARSRFTGVPSAAVLAMLTVVALIELAALTGAAGAPVLPLAGLVGTLLLAMLPCLMRLSAVAPYGGVMPAIVVLWFALVLAFAEQMARHRVEKAASRIAATMLAVVYLGVGVAMTLAIRLRFGVPALVMFLCAVKFTDIGAYFTGSAIGRHKMIKWLSPGKSWEGLAGGMAAAAGMSVLVSWAMGVGVDWPKALAFGAVMAVIGQFSDLCESLLKRAAGAKDSGRLVPEYGGVLDMIDSLLLTSPAAYMLLAAWAGTGSLT